MSKLSYNVISTGSEGNAVIIEKNILIDCGVSFKALKSYLHDIKIVLLTHIHTDHFNKRTLRMLAAERPTLRFACGLWLATDVLACGIPKENLDIMEAEKIYNYGIFSVKQIPLSHNVPNCGYKIHFPCGKMIYATDTNNLNGINAYHYDLYLLEANYGDEEIQERIKEKKANGEYAYEIGVLQNHLSKAKCDDFIYRNIGANGEYVYLHQHREKNNEEGEN